LAKGFANLEGPKSGNNWMLLIKVGLRVSFYKTKF